MLDYKNIWTHKLALISKNPADNFQATHLCDDTGF